jgi:cyanophycinase-like exopeptidase
MPVEQGFIALMGSGELTATMVEVHKELLGRLPGAPRAVFLDTPAGFQQNVAEIARRAAAYFRTRVGQSMAVAAFPSADTPPLEAELAFRTLREADYILMGPGSPTYTVRTLAPTPVPAILAACFLRGGCLTAASAAALTVGRLTLPVYEIYKVGEPPHWTEGLNLLQATGLDLVVVPHWNNAEGGTHDTRFCFMGRERFDRLESQLPAGTDVLGLDEHTALIIDFRRDEAVVRGLGGVTLRRDGGESVFAKGERIPLAVLRSGTPPPGGRRPLAELHRSPGTGPSPSADGFWVQVHALDTRFQEGLEHGDLRSAASALLELDAVVWQAHLHLEDGERIAQAREILREQMARLGMLPPPVGASCGPIPAELLGGLLDLREELRRGRQWGAADTLRDLLARNGITVTDTAAGPRWRRDAEER